MRRKPRKLIKNEYTEKVKESMKTFYDSLSEKDRRRYAAIEVLKFGYGGKKYICKILGCDIETINRGLEELLNGFSTRVRLCLNVSKEPLHTYQFYARIHSIDSSYKA